MDLTDEHEPAWTQPLRRQRRAALKEKAVVRLRKGGLVPPFPDHIRRLSERALREALPREERGFGGSRLYLAEFQGPGQYVKAGKARDWRDRICTHQSIAGVHGYALVDLWVSPRVTDADSVEASLLYSLRVFPGVSLAGREYFYGLSFGSAVEVAQGLSDWKWKGIPLGQPTPLP